MDINSSIFKAYDIRGVYPNELDEQAAYRIGRAYASYIRVAVLDDERPPVIIINEDARISSPGLKEKLVKGLVDEGSRVIDCGLSTTPMHVFAVNHFKADGGVMVTASHNPAKFNGFKISRRGAVPIGMGSGMEEICNAVVRGVFSIPKHAGKVDNRSIEKNYLEFVRSLIEIPPQSRRLKIIFDTGNGMVGLFLRKFLESFPIDPIILFEDMDMSFPNHEANPSKEETLDALKRKVMGEKADLGVAFDGDGDRIRFIAPSGYALPGDITTALFAEQVLKGAVGKKVVYAINSSRVVREVVKMAGGVPVESRIGRTYVRLAMQKEQALFGAEITGHFYWKEFFFAESSLFSFLYMLNILLSAEKNLNELIGPFMRYINSGEINMTVEDKDKVLDEIAVEFTDGTIRYTDGISVEYPDVWFNVRPSNTEPLVRAVVEGENMENVEKVKKRLLEILKRI